MKGWVTSLDAAQHCFGPRLRKRRRDCCMKQAVLARLSGVHRKTIVNCEKGLAFPMLATAFLLARVLKCTIDDLIDPSRDMPPVPSQKRNGTGGKPKVHRKAGKKDA